MSCASSRGAAAALVLLARFTLIAACCGCSRFPTDPEGTTERVDQTHVIRVGATEHRPWVVREPNRSDASGIEADFIREFAIARGARVEFRWGQLDMLMGALEHFELDLLIGGIDETTPWKDRVGLSDPWFELHESRLVVAVPPGENGWLGELTGYLRQHAKELERRGLKAAQ